MATPDLSYVWGGRKKKKKVAKIVRQMGDEQKNSRKEERDCI